MKIDKKLSTSRGFAPLTPSRVCAPGPGWGLCWNYVLTMIHPLGKSWIRPGDSRDIIDILCGLYCADLFR